MTNQRVKIIPSDKIVIMGDTLFHFDFTTDDNYHAIQWDGEKGFIETKQGDNIKLNNLDEFSSILEEHTRLADDKRNADEAEEAYRKTNEYKNHQAEKNRREAYQTESDSLFFSYQRDEIDKQVWLDKVKEIKQRYPYINGS